MRGYLPLIQKDSSTHMHGLKVYLKEGQELSLVNPADSYLRFRLALLYSVSYFIFLYRSPSLSFKTVFYPILFKMEEVLSINPSVFGDFNVHHKD